MTVDELANDAAFFHLQNAQARQQLLAAISHVSLQCNRLPDRLKAERWLRQIQ